MPPKVKESFSVAVYGSGSSQVSAARQLSDDRMLINWSSDDEWLWDFPLHGCEWTILEYGPSWECMKRFVDAKKNAYSDSIRMPAILENLFIKRQIYKKNNKILRLPGYNKKEQRFLVALCGAEGTRTLDLRRDRPAF